MALLKAGKYSLKEGTPKGPETIRSISLLRKLGQLRISGSEDFSNLARLLRLFSLFCQASCSKGLITFKCTVCLLAVRLDLGEYPACKSSFGSDLNASAKIISSMLSIRVVSLSDEFLVVGSRNS